MRAVVANGGEITVDTVDEPALGAGQLLVAPLASGICGSDLHLLESQAAMPDVFPPIVLGHEYVGRVIEVGPGAVRGIKPGAIVTSVPFLDTSAGPQLIGLSPLAGGALAERMVLQESRAIEVPDGVDPEHAAFAEPLAVGAHAVGAGDLRLGDVALVIGCGPIGLAVVAALKAAGHGPVVAADFSPSRRRLAEAMGADIVIDPALESPYTAWADLAAPAPPPSPLWERALHGRTVVFECVGIPGVLQTVIDNVPPHSRVIVVGVCQQPDTITPMVAIAKELSLKFVLAYRPEEFEQALSWITHADINVGPLITARLELGDAPFAFDQLQPPSEHCKIMLSPHLDHSDPPPARTDPS